MVIKRSKILINLKCQFVLLGILKIPHFCYYVEKVIFNKCDGRTESRANLLCCSCIIIQTSIVVIAVTIIYSCLLHIYIKD